MSDYDNNLTSGPVKLPAGYQSSELLATLPLRGVGFFREAFGLLEDATKYRDCLGSLRQAEAEIVRLRDALSEQMRKYDVTLENERLRGRVKKSGEGEKV